MSSTAEEEIKVGVVPWEPPIEHNWLHNESIVVFFSVARVMNFLGFKGGQGGMAALEPNFLLLGAMISSYSSCGTHLLIT